MPFDGNGRRTFRKRVLLGILLGLPGVLSLLLVLPAIPGIPRLALLINPLLLLIVMATVGAACAPRAGLASGLLLGAGIKSARLLGRMLVVGALIGIGVALLDKVLAGSWRGSSDVPSLIDVWSGAQFLVGVLYGGTTEEVVMRWGLLSGVLWGLLRFFGTNPRAWRMAASVALCISAAAFAAGHLPAILTSGALTPPLLIRTLGLNFALGLAFGSAFLLHHLEAAICLHIGFHIGVAIAAIGIVPTVL